MLFARDSRVVLVSAPVEAFLGRPRGELLGRTVQEVFARDTLLGTALLDSFERRRPISQRDFEAAGGKRIQVSLDFVQEKNSQIGALLIMRGPADRGRDRDVKTPLRQRASHTWSCARG